MTPASSPVAFTDTSAADVIRLNKVSQVYDGGDRVIIDNLDLLIEKRAGHQFAVILGQSGCGKSTLLRYVAGLQKPTSGEVFVNGAPLTSSGAVSMVFQQYSSMPWMTVLDNVALPLRVRGESKSHAREQAMDMLKAVGLEGHEMKYAKSPLLSGGQLQRVAIARSLIANAEIILMDEPFGALDLNTRLDMQLLLADIYERVRPTIVFVTHDIQEAVFLGDDIYVMSANPGRIVNHIEVNLGLHRDRATKRDKRFLDLTYQVEDVIEQVRKASLTK